MTNEYDIVADELDEPTCWRLVAQAGFGRVGFIDDGTVAVLPVNAAVSHRRVVFRTGARSSLAALRDGTDVAFEADQIDEVAEAGWSVVIRGSLRGVTDASEAAELDGSGLRPWAPNAAERWMVITPSKVTGRSIQRHRNLPPGSHVPYMPPD